MISLRWDNGYHGFLRGNPSTTNSSVNVFSFIFLLIIPGYLWPIVTFVKWRNSHLDRKSQHERVNERHTLPICVKRSLRDVGVPYFIR